MSTQYNIIILFFLVALKITQAQTPPVILSDASEIILIGKHTEILIDSTNHLDIDQVAKKANEFINHQKDIPAFGISKCTFWVKFDIENQIDKDENFVLEVNKIDVLTLSLYHKNKAGNFVHQQIKTEHKKYNGRLSLFNLHIPKNTVKTYYLKFKSNWSTSIPLKIATKNRLMHKLFNIEIINGMLFGIFLIMAFYNLFIYFAIRDKSYLFYVIYIFSFLLFQVNENGYFYKYFLYKSPYTYSIFAKVLSITTAIAAIYFIRSFIQAPKYIPKLDRFHFALVVLFALNLLLAVDVKFNSIAFISLNILSLITSFYALIIGFIVTLKGFKPARFFLAAWIILLICITQFTLTNLGIFPYTEVTDHLLKIGSVIEIVLLSFGLANRINVLTKENEIAQAKALQLASEKETIILNQKEELEKQVEQRTKSLQLKNETIVKQNEEKSTMMREIHHRVKNNLQMINSMIRLQTRFVEDKSSEKVLSKVQRRILTMAQLHEKMYQSENLKFIGIEDYINTIVSDLLNIHDNNKNTYKLQVDDTIEFDTETTLYLGLLISELVINALKHAFTNQYGIIAIDLKKITSHTFELKVADNGKGFTPVNFYENNSLGQRLIQNFIKQLNGNLHINSSEYGSEFIINFSTTN